MYHNLAMLVTGSKDKTVEMFPMSKRSVNMEDEEEEEEQCVYSFTEHRGDICCVSHLVTVWFVILPVILFSD